MEVLSFNYTKVKRIRQIIQELHAKAWRLLEYRQPSRDPKEGSTVKASTHTYLNVQVVSEQPEQTNITLQGHSNFKRWRKPHLQSKD